MEKGWIKYVKVFITKHNLIIGPEYRVFMYQRAMEKMAKNKNDFDMKTWLAYALVYIQYEYRPESIKSHPEHMAQAKEYLEQIPQWESHLREVHSQTDQNWQLQ